MSGRLAAWWSLRRQRLHAWRMARAPGRVPLVIRLIATGKLVKGAGFLVLAVCLGRLVHAPDVEAWVAAFLDHIHIDPDGRHAQRAIAWISSMPHQRLVAVAAGAYAWSVLYLIEGFGLWFDRPWAEWLTTIGTALFIPVEAIHLWHKPTIGIAVVLAINLAVTAYLGRRLWLRRRPAQPPR